jgi:hypothetical protein
MEGIELRPLSLGELLDRTFTLYRSHFWLFAGIMAIPSSAAIPFSFFTLVRTGSPFGLGHASPAAQAFLFSGTFLGFGLFFFAVYAIAQGAATHAVGDAYLGRSSTVRSAYSRIRGRFWRLIGLIVNVGIRVFGLMVLALFAAALGGGLIAAFGRGNQIAAMIGGLVIMVLILAAFGLSVWFGLRYSVSIPAMLLANITGRQAIKRSVELSRGRRGHIFMAVLLAAVLSYVGVIIFQGPFYIAMIFMASKGQLPPWLMFTMAVSGAVGGALTGPIMMIVLVLSYYDLRIRKEGFDLQFMMASLGEPRPLEATSAGLGQLSP